MNLDNSVSKCNLRASSVRACVQVQWLVINKGSWKHSIGTFNIEQTGAAIGIFQVFHILSAVYYPICIHTREFQPLKGVRETCLRVTTRPNTCSLAPQCEPKRNYASSYLYCYSYPTLPPANSTKFYSIRCHILFIPGNPAMKEWVERPV